MNPRQAFLEGAGGRTIEIQTVVQTGVENQAPPQGELAEAGDVGLEALETKHLMLFGQVAFPHIAW